MIIRARRRPNLTHHTCGYVTVVQILYDGVPVGVKKSHYRQSFDWSVTEKSNKHFSGLGVGVPFRCLCLPPGLAKIGFLLVYSSLKHQTNSFTHGTRRADHRSSPLPWSIYRQIIQGGQIKCWTTAVRSAAVRSSSSFVAGWRPAILYNPHEPVFLDWVCTTVLQKGTSVSIYAGSYY